MDFPSSSALPSAVAEKLRHLPAPAHAAYDAFRRSGEPDHLDPLLFALLENYLPKKPAMPIASLPGTTLLMEDLGFDSLAIAEFVFSTEDLFEIRIANEEVVKVRTLDDLRAFIRQKVGSRAG